jgi:hypothetical protein
MKSITILLVAMLAIAGSAYAQSDTSATAAAQGTYPAGTTFGGTAISALQIASATLIASDGSAEGQITISLIGPVNPLTGTQQIISIDAEPSGGTKTAGNVVTITGTCSVDMGTGTPVTGVPFVATITTNDQHLGSLGLVIGATSLPTAAINDGSMTIVGPSSSFAQISLGTAQSFAVLGSSTVTNTGLTSVTGDLGVSPGTAVTGFLPGVVTGGAIHAGDTAAAQAQADVTTAYNAATSTACKVDLTGQDLGSLTLTPGVYCFASSAFLTGTLTLNFQGNPSAFFLFKMGSTLTTASDSKVVLINAVNTTCPPNLYWQVGSSATFGTGSSFAGNVIALASITMTTNVQLNGRALARNGAVTMDTNAVTQTQ